MVTRDEWIEAGVAALSSPGVEWEDFPEIAVERVLDAALPVLRAMEAWDMALVDPGPDEWTRYEEEGR